MMKDILSNVFLVLISFSTGVVVAGGVFAFISAIGVVPRFAQRTKTQKYIPLYEDAILIGGVFGTTTMFIDYSIPIGNFFAGFFGFAAGVFYGCLAISLTEVINVIPIFLRRARITKGLPIMITGIALGKLLGSLIYFLVKGFYVM
jgi:stage V sporulation protein AB